MKSLIFKVTKSIDFTILLVRVWLSINPLYLLIILKMMIMKTIKNITKILIRIEILNFIKSVVLGVTFVERDGPTSDYKV